MPARASRRGRGAQGGESCTSFVSSAAATRRLQVERRHALQYHHHDDDKATRCVHSITDHAIGNAKLQDHEDSDVRSLLRTARTNSAEFRKSKLPNLFQSAFLAYSNVVCFFVHFDAHESLIECFMEIERRERQYLLLEYACASEDYTLRCIRQMLWLSTPKIESLCQVYCRNNQRRDEESLRLSQLCDSFDHLLKDVTLEANDPQTLLDLLYARLQSLQDFEDELIERLVDYESDQLHHNSFGGRSRSANFMKHPCRGGITPSSRTVFAFTFMGSSKYSSSRIYIYVGIFLQIVAMGLLYTVVGEETFATSVSRTFALLSGLIAVLFAKYDTDTCSRWSMLFFSTLSISLRLAATIPASHIDDCSSAFGIVGFPLASRIHALIGKCDSPTSNYNSASGLYALFIVVANALHSSSVALLLPPGRVAILAHTLPIATLAVVSFWSTIPPEIVVNFFGSKVEVYSFPRLYAILFMGMTKVLGATCTFWTAHLLLLSNNPATTAKVESYSNSSSSRSLAMTADEKEESTPLHSSPDKFNTVDVTEDDSSEDTLDALGEIHTIGEISTKSNPSTAQQLIADESRGRKRLPRNLQLNFEEVRPLAPLMIPDDQEVSSPLRRERVVSPRASPLSQRLFDRHSPDESVGTRLATSRDSFVKLMESKDHDLTRMREYEQIRVLGQGSFATAYLLRSHVTGDLVVCKKMRVAGVSLEDVRRIENEVCVHTKLRHPNINACLDTFHESKAYLCIMLEYADGGTLANSIEKQASMREPFFTEVIQVWLQQLGSAVKYMHESGVLHRDISSQNIFLTLRGEVKLGDFGLSTIESPAISDQNPVMGPKGRSSRTEYGATQMYGTPVYASPELVNGESYGAPADIWALGVILFELLTLRWPFEAPSITALLRNISEARYDEASLASCSHPFHLRKLASNECMLNPDPYCRTTAPELLGALSGTRQEL